MGMIVVDQRSKSYEAGPRMLRLLHASASRDWIEHLTRPHLQALADKLDETCYLARLVGDRVMIGFSLAPAVAWRSYVVPGAELPPHASAAGKAILAYQTPDFVRRVLDRQLPKFTINTTVDFESLFSGLQTVRENKLASCIGEIDQGLGAIAVPVIQSNDEVLHAVGIAGPLQRIMNENYDDRVAALRECAAALTAPLNIGIRLAGEPPSEERGAHP